MTDTTITAVVLGDHADGDTVTVTGRAGNIQCHVTKQDNQWATFLLICEDTAVRVALLPEPYLEQSDALVPDRVDGRARPPLVTVTGRVDRSETVPTLMATTVTRKDENTSRGGE